MRVRGLGGWKDREALRTYARVDGGVKALDGTRLGGGGVDWKQKIKVRGIFQRPRPGYLRVLYVDIGFGRVRVFLVVESGR